MEIYNIKEIEKTKIIQDGYHNAIKILLVVATDTERNVVIEKIRPLPNNSSIFKCFEGSQTYYFGVLGCFPICLVKTTMIGSLKRDASFSTVTEALNAWNFRIVIMPGIAFGRNKGVEKSQQSLCKNSDIKHKSLYNVEKFRPKKIQPKQRLLCITRISSSLSENN